jgi:hypothetical protein
MGSREMQGEPFGEAGRLRMGGRGFDNGSDTGEEPKSDDGGGALTNFAVSMTIPNGVGWTGAARFGDRGPLTEVFVGTRSADFDRRRTVWGGGGGGGVGDGSGVGDSSGALDGRGAGGLGRRSLGLEADAQEWGMASSVWRGPGAVLGRKARPGGDLCREAAMGQRSDVRAGGETRMSEAAGWEGREQSPGGA